MKANTEKAGREAVSEQYQLLPPLTDEEYGALKEDIRQNGIIVPVIVDENGVVLDGHHRVKIAKELGITDYDVKIRRYEDEDGKIEDAIKLNLARRQLSRDQKQSLAADLRARGWTLERIGECLAVSHETVRSWIPESAFRNMKAEGADGKAYPMVYAPRAKTSVTVTRQKQAESALSMLDEVAPEGSLTFGDLYKAKKDVEREGRRHAMEAEYKSSVETRPVIASSEWAKWLPLQPDADLVLTDPPYMTDVEDIEAFAHHWLPRVLCRVKPTGRAYVFVGAYASELLAYLSADRAGMELEDVLVWTYRNTMGPCPSRGYKQNWQACLHFVGAEAGPLDCPSLNERFSVQDVNAPDGRLGDRYHAWQKPIELAERIVRHSTKEGDVVLDPFAGTGTHILAAAKLGRVGLGCDASEQMVAIAEQRGCVRGS
jgi:hypothetical protein